MGSLASVKEFKTRQKHGEMNKCVPAKIFTSPPSDVSECWKKVTTKSPRQATADGGGYTLPLHNKYLPLSEDVVNLDQQEIPLGKGLADIEQHNKVKGKSPKKLYTKSKQTPRLKTKIYQVKKVCGSV